MILCVNVSKRTKDQMDRLLEVGEYSDYSEVVSVAISNQILLHVDGGDPAHVVPPAVVSATNPPVADVQLDHSKRISPLFAPIRADVAGVKIAPITPDEFASMDEIPIDQWIFGQHNKLLPVKATCRALANMVLRDLASYEGVSLHKAASEIASEAALLGDVLRHFDQVSGSHRDDTMAFAFPRSDSANGDKSRLRFASQFVANLSNQGTLTGLPADLKLVNKDDSRTPRLLLTQAGWDFARMANPILDGAEGHHLGGKFSDEEVGFLIAHVKANVPWEDFAIRTVLNAITDGANTPDALDDSLARLLPRRESRPFTRAFLTTQRAGVISRLIDLGLIRRVRDGIKVTYTATDRTFNALHIPLERMA